jgi:hypothetical protein
MFSSVKFNNAISLAELANGCNKMAEWKNLKCATL